MGAQTYFRLLRIEQWYKNLVVFLALFFTGNVFNAPLIHSSVLAFAALCSLSSSYYILNDIRDAEADRRHPEKRRRPIACGDVSCGVGYVLSISLICLSFALAGGLSKDFISLMLLLFASGLSYNLWLRDIAFIDLHVIGINFLIRAVAGAVAIGVPASPWLVTTVFFTALLLGVSKRRSELSLLGDEAVKFKPVYSVYTRELLDVLLIVVSSILLFSYILYTFSVHTGGFLMLTIPFATFVIFRYLHLTLTDHVAARKIHRLIYDWQILVAIVVWGLVTFYLMYVLKS
jgi:4-hydroxybenzoate polyprenyltransferase